MHEEESSSNFLLPRISSLPPFLFRNLSLHAVGLLQENSLLAFDEEGVFRIHENRVPVIDQISLC